jgi:16S rRNA (guanine527-N7)-methyltransferase
MQSERRSLEQALRGQDVSCETIQQLETFGHLLLRWNKTVNLISRADAHDIWTRHIADSAQIYRLAPTTAETWCDLGSGGGLPGLVCALLAQPKNPDLRFTLIESSGRKAAFLREAARQFGLNVDVRTTRIEETTLDPQDVISARALADLPELLKYAYPFCHDDTVMLFPKGRRHESELTDARSHWQMTVKVHASDSMPDGVIHEIRGVTPLQ